MKSGPGLAQTKDFGPLTRWKMGGISSTLWSFIDRISGPSDECNGIGCPAMMGNALFTPTIWVWRRCRALMCRALMIIDGPEPGSRMLGYSARRTCGRVGIRRVRADGHVSAGWTACGRRRRSAQDDPGSQGGRCCSGRRRKIHGPGPSRMLASGCRAWCRDGTQELACVRNPFSSCAVVCFVLGSLGIILGTVYRTPVTVTVLLTVRRPYIF